VTGFAPSLRNRGFVSTDAKGDVHLSHATTLNTLSKVKVAGDAAKAIAVSPRRTASPR